ncbi:hypothetical protein EYF80_021118 [Liparis tanakae]|uniref:Uncharacterized protein n=1 Tax=Liparis tanakae TaxID=230148 RepID=A0A4Z2HUC3_9TELE|nr:hypothetical protein EYF80_021118 [Liparis tanakae]
MQEDVRFGGVAVDVEQAEVCVLQFLEQAEPVPHHRRVVAAHLKARPVQVKLQQQLTHRLQNSFQDQVRLLQAGIEAVHLTSGPRERSLQGPIVHAQPAAHTAQDNQV